MIVSGCSGRLDSSSGAMESRETVMDGQIHIEEDIHWEIPDVPRLCDSLPLQKLRIDIGDCELYVEREGKGIPIVLLHGGPGSTHHGFHPYFSEAAEFAQVIYYDQRGCGLSDYEKGEGYNVNQAAADLEALREALGIRQWVVLGHSYGGFLAQYYITLYPESVIGLVIVTGSAGLHDPNLRGSRQYTYISEKERGRIRDISQKLRARGQEERWSRARGIALYVYNAQMNGDWKRQNFYCPTMDEFAFSALYDWSHDFDNNFNGIMSSSYQKEDLRGAFENCPIPTLIMEALWDLTWVEAKPILLHRNHPHARMVIFSRSAHSPFADEPEPFFTSLKHFIDDLEATPAARLDVWKAELVEWKRKQEESLDYALRQAGWGHRSNQKIAARFSKESLEEIDSWSMKLKVGMALYDLKRYDDALWVFNEMDKDEKAEGERSGIPQIWQGFVLDLLGKRSEAVSVYQRVVDLKTSSTQSHSQFGLTYNPSQYAAELMRKPFTRIENKDID